MELDSTEQIEEINTNINRLNFLCIWGDAKCPRTQTSLDRIQKPALSVCIFAAAAAIIGFGAYIAIS